MFFVVDMAFEHDLLNSIIRIPVDGNMLVLSVIYAICGKVCVWIVVGFFWSTAPLWL